MRTPFTHRSESSLPGLLACALLLVTLAAAPARADDAVGDFNVFSNVSTARWSYGITPSLGGAFTLLPTTVIDAASRKGWKNASNDQVMKNVNGFDVNIGGINVPAGALTIEPKTIASFVVVRWLAPSSGNAIVNARFIRYSTATFQASQVAILHSGAKVYSRWLVRDVTPVLSTTITLAVTAGQVLDFVVGTGDGNATGDIVGLDATVHLEPFYNAAGPVIHFAGERFVACAGDSAAESIAFDPSNHRIASNGIIRSLCGSPLSNGPDLAPGLAWDSKTHTYWQITNAGVVKQWSAAGAFLTDLFTIPGGGQGSASARADTLSLPRQEQHEHAQEPDTPPPRLG